MTNYKKRGGCGAAICAVIVLAVPWSPAVGGAYAQVGETDAYRRTEARFQNTGTVADAIRKVKQGEFLAVHVEEIAEAGATEAIPVLKEQFARAADSRQREDFDPGNKGKVASALVRLGDKDPVYWDFLVKQATDAVESDIPLPTRFDAQGKIVPHQLSPEFEAWTKAHDVSPESVGQVAAYELPVKLGYMAETGDPRGLPLLRRAMSSSNYMIQSMAAKGLAKLDDKDSIPVIVAACAKAPAEISPAIAEALVYFDDPRAQSAAERYLPKEYFKSLRDGRHVPGNDVFIH